ncbi:MAG: hypothetical protein SGI90_07205 [Candidatus Eisenbacteria bacterium]|nr:hypothetical protein [Candidatus Eisenbacteria bacterium]
MPGVRETGRRWVFSLAFAILDVRSQGRYDEGHIPWALDAHIMPEGTGSIPASLFTTATSFVIYTDNREYLNAAILLMTLASNHASDPRNVWAAGS